LDLVTQEFFLFRVKLCLVNLFERVSFFGILICYSKDFGEFSSTEFSHVLLIVELLDVMVATMELETFDPLIDDLLVLMEEHTLPEALSIMVDVEAEHGSKLNLFEVKTLQKDNVFRLNV